MREHTAEFDVIITDSSDPIGAFLSDVLTPGPASTLFEKEYYHLMRAALRPGGIVCSQGVSSTWSNDLVTKFSSCFFLHQGKASGSIFLSSHI